MGCSLETMIARRRATELLGIQVTGSSIELDLSFFNCCHGTGRDFAPPTMAAYRCELRSRLVGANQFYDRFIKVFSGVLNQASAVIQPAVTADDEVLFKRWVAHPSSSQWIKADSGSLERLLGIGLLASWVHGYRTSLYSLERGSFSGNLLDPAKWTNASTRNLVIVWGLGRTWDQDVAGFFEQLLQYTLRYNLRLLLAADYQTTAVPIRTGRGRMPSHLHENLRKLTDGPPKGWFGGRIRSLMQEHFGEEYSKLEKVWLPGVNA